MEQAARSDDNKTKAKAKTKAKTKAKDEDEDKAKDEYNLRAANCTGTGSLVSGTSIRPDLADFLSRNSNTRATLPVSLDTASGSSRDSDDTQISKASPEATRSGSARPGRRE